MKKSSPVTINPDAASLSSREQAAILLVTAIAGFSSTFMSSSVNIALPVIENEFHISPVVMGWIPLAYVLTSGAGLMPAAQLANRFGRKRVFLWGLVIFTAFCAACGLSPSAGWLIASRLLMGVGAALVFSSTVAMVTDAYPLARRGWALGLLISGVYLGTTMGPAVGGIITHNIGWRGQFWIIAGLSAVNCLLTATLVRGVDWREVEPRPFDVVGSLIFVLALPAFLLGLSLLPGTHAVVLLVVGLSGLGLFLWWEARAENPILRVDLLRENRVFAFSNLSSLINYCATFAMTFLMSIYLGYVRGLNAQTAGFVLVAGLAVQVLMSGPAGRLVDRVQARLVASAGMALCVLALLGLSFLGETTPYWRVVGLLCILGVGVALFAPAITHAVMSSVGRHDMSVASATQATMRSVGQNISQGIATLVLALVVGQHAIGPSDYPGVLKSVRITFGILTVLCVFGLAASLVGRRAGPKEQGHLGPRGVK